MADKYNPFSIEGKRILVTGASSGIGRAVAIECSKVGAHVIISGRNPERLAQTLESMEGEGHEIIGADLSTEEGVDALIGALPKLDGMVLCAGIVELWPFQFVSQKRFQKIYQTNLFSPIEIMRQIVKKKLYNKGFSIIAISSISGISDFVPSNSIYGSGKAALSSFVKYAANELASKQIRVNTISPGFIYTPIHKNGSISEEDLNKVIEKTPIKRWGQPEEIAYAAIYLLSEAAAYITGTDIKIDGGYSIPFKS